jgi:hypothetical protein
MLSRRSAQALAVLYSNRFTRWTRGGTSGSRHVRHADLYDFLYLHDYPAWLCNLADRLRGDRAVKEWLMKLHTGETQVSATPNWSWEQRRQLGQQFLRELAEDMLNLWHKEARPDHYGKLDGEDDIKELVASLELDGYVYRDSRLLQPESDVLDVEEARGVLEELIGRLQLSRPDTAFHHLKLSEDHFIAGRWDDSISNSRKFLEWVLQEGAAVHSVRVRGTPLSERVTQRPVEVREYLTTEGLLEKKEGEAIASVYGLLSHTGGHPYMAEGDQARLLRQMSLTLSQFVLLRLEGSLTASSPG